MLRKVVTLASPAILAITLVLDSYGQMSGHWLSLGRPIIVTTVVAAALTVGLVALTRRTTLASAVGSAAVCYLFGQSGLLGIAIIAIAGVFLWQHWRLVTRRSAAAVPPLAAVLPVIALFVVVVASRVADGSLAPADLVVSPTSAIQPNASGGANVYVLMLDGYPRSDDLEAEFAFDNRAFLTELEGMGFDIDPDSRSPFAETSLTLAASMLDDSRSLSRWRAADFQGEVIMRREIRRQYLVNTPVMDRYRLAGYQLIYVASPVTHTDWAGWDVRVDSGNLTDVETFLIQRSPLRFALGDWVMSQQRSRLRASLAAWADQAASPRDRQVVFAHIMAPHPPFLYGPDGAERSPLPCWYAQECNIYHHRAADLDISLLEYADYLIPNLQELNRQVLSVIGEVVARDPGAAIVVFSDHGARYSESKGDEWYRTLFAARLPSEVAMIDLQPSGLFVTIADALGEER